MLSAATSSRSRFLAGDSHSLQQLSFSTQLAARRGGTVGYFAVYVTLRLHMPGALGIYLLSYRERRVLDETRIRREMTVEVNRLPGPAMSRPPYRPGRRKTAAKNRRLYRRSIFVACSPRSQGRPVAEIRGPRENAAHTRRLDFQNLSGYF